MVQWKRYVKDNVPMQKQVRKKTSLIHVQLRGEANLFETHACVHIYAHTNVHTWLQFQILAL